MAEEAMASLGSKYFNFNEDGDYVPYGSSGTVDAGLDEVPSRNHSNQLHAHDTSDEPSLPWEITLANRVAEYYAFRCFHAPRSPHRQYGFLDTLPPVDSSTTAGVLAYLEANEPTPIETIEQFEALVASHQLANSDASSPGTALDRAQVQDPAQISDPVHDSDLPQAPASQSHVLAASAPVSSGIVPSSTATTGLGLVVNGKTLPRIEAGKERWYSQRPGENRSYSRYSDLVSHDKAKSVTPMPRASKTELQAARHDKTFG
jgi:hypothetical protein